MSPSGSRQTLSANLIQQICAALLLVSLPNLLEKDAYAQIVFVGVLLSFITMADLGMSLVFGRLVPRLVITENQVELKRWNAAVSRFGLMAAAFFSLVTALIYWRKYEHAGYAATFAFVPIALYWTSLHVSRTAAQGNFTEYGRVTAIRSLASLIAIPMVMLAGLSGWFASQVIAGALAVGYAERRTREPVGPVDWDLVRNHLPEGLMLCFVSASWMQLINFGRLYASLGYPQDTVAYYGVVGAAYQSLSTILISAFLPVSVGILARLGREDGEAIEYIRNVLLRTVWWILAGTIFVAELAPYALELIFPKYHFDRSFLLPLLLGIVFHPFFLLLGNCMVGKQKPGAYLLVILISLGGGGLAAWSIDFFFEGHGAAWGQLFGLLLFTGSLTVITRLVFGAGARHDLREIQRTLAFVTLMVGIYASLRSG